MAKHAAAERGDNCSVAGYNKSKGKGRPPTDAVRLLSAGFVPATRLGREFGVLGRLCSSVMRFAPFATSVADGRANRDLAKARSLTIHHWGVGAQAIAAAMTEQFSLNSVSRLLLNKSGAFEELDHRLLDGDLQKKWSFSQNKIEQMFHL